MGQRIIKCNPTDTAELSSKYLYSDKSFTKLHASKLAHYEHFL